jgi:uncharacterized protein
MEDEVVGRVSQIWRYPVKSLRGEQLGCVKLVDGGLEVDHSWACYGRDGKIGAGRTVRRFPLRHKLLQLSSCTGQDGSVRVCFPDGTLVLAGQDDLNRRISDLIGEEVSVAPSVDERHPQEAAVHLLTFASLDWAISQVPGEEVAIERFRPNLVISGTSGELPEGSWLGRRVTIGSAVLRVESSTVRCPVVTLSQGRLAPAPRLLRAIKAKNDLCLGVYCSVQQTGTISSDDPVTLSA